MGADTGCGGHQGGQELEPGTGSDPGRGGSRGDALPEEGGAPGKWWPNLSTNHVTNDHCPIPSQARINPIISDIRAFAEYGVGQVTAMTAASLTINENHKLLFTASADARQPEQDLQVGDMVDYCAVRNDSPAYSMYRVIWAKLIPKEDSRIAMVRPQLGNVLQDFAKVGQNSRGIQIQAESLTFRFISEDNQSWANLGHKDDYLKVVNIGHADRHLQGERRSTFSIIPPLQYHSPIRPNPTQHQYL